MSAVPAASGVKVIRPSVLVATVNRRRGPGDLDGVLPDGLTAIGDGDRGWFSLIGNGV
jgi:hypothetical protein